MLAILIWNGVIIVRQQLGQHADGAAMPMAFQYMAMPVGSGGALVFVVYDLFQILRGKSREERYGTDDDARHPGLWCFFVIALAGMPLITR